jgi:hypothetical protein
MVATSDFSGLVSSACALANAAAKQAMDSLDRCMAALRDEEVEAHGPGFRALGADACRAPAHDDPGVGAADDSLTTRLQ